MRLNFSAFLLISLFSGFVGSTQTKFTVNDFNYYTIRDSINKIVYSFDTGSEDSNLFDRKAIQYKPGAITLLNNASGNAKFTRKAKITQEINGLGIVKTNANILGDEEFTKNNCIEIDLLLGTRELRKHILSFNNKTSILTKLDKLPVSINQYIKLELTYNMFDDCYYVELEINGGKEKFLIDTADSYGITLKSDKYLSKHTDFYSFMTLVAFKEEESKMLKFENNSIGHKGHMFKKDVVYQNDKFDNIIGNAFFLNFEEVIFDLKNKSIYLLNEVNNFDPFNEDVLFSPNEDKEFEIIYIKGSSGYYENGFRVGDKVALKDAALSNQLLLSPCHTRSILKNWKSTHNSAPEFTKL